MLNAAIAFLYLPRPNSALPIPSWAGAAPGSIDAALLNAAIAFLYLPRPRSAWPLPKWPPSRSG